MSRMSSICGVGSIIVIGFPADRIYLDSVLLQKFSCSDVISVLVGQLQITVQFIASNSAQTVTSVIILDGFMFQLSVVAWLSL